MIYRWVFNILFLFSGLNFDFVSLNFLGFTLYSVYNLELYYNKEIQQEYFNLNSGKRIFLAIAIPFSKIITRGVIL